MKVQEFIKKCTGEAYPQPLCDNHKASMHKIIDQWIVPEKPLNVLDIGCGQGEALEYFKELGIDALGITVGIDYAVCNSKKLNVVMMDMHDLWGIEDNKFDVVFIRHALEHSPIPMYVLNEMKRITKKWIIVVVPPDSIGVDGMNHYSVFHTPLWIKLMKYVGLEVVEEKADDEFVIEHWYKLRKND